MGKRSVCLFVLVCLLPGGPGFAASRACFTPDEATAADFRILKEELNVAARNCQTLDPSLPSFPERYNAFIVRFEDKLKENALMLTRHFSRAGGNINSWMTKVANEAGYHVHSDPGYCQSAWEHLDMAMNLSAVEIDEFVQKTVFSPSVEPCPAPHAPRKAESGPAHAIHTAQAGG